MLSPFVALAEKPADFDIITMKNGDIHQGTAAIEFTSIKTSLGAIKSAKDEFSIWEDEQAWGDESKFP